MRIGGYRRERRGESVVVGARIEWEEAREAPIALEIEAEGAAAEHLLPDANGFLVAAAFPAARRGERRVAVEGAVCPALRDGLSAAARVLQGWYGGGDRLPSIEPSGGFRAPVPPPARAASYLSGGVDSAEILLANRRHFAGDHPARIADAILLEGFPQANPAGTDARRNFAGRALRSARSIAAAFGAEFTRVTTNLSEIEPDHAFAEKEWYGAGFAALAHLFSSRFTSVALASDYSFSRPMRPNGSHPLLDPLYGSASIAFVVEGTARTRLEKAAGLAARPDVVGALMVCHETPLPHEGANCGRCEKCVRTRLELLLAGAGATPAFPGPLAPDRETIAAVRQTAALRTHWPPLAAPLRAAGRDDLAAAVEEKVADGERIARWLAGAGWKGWLRRADRRFFGGRALAMRRRIVRPPAAAS